MSNEILDGFGEFACIPVLLIFIGWIILGPLQILLALVDWFFGTNLCWY